MTAIRKLLIWLINRFLLRKSALQLIEIPHPTKPKKTVIVTRPRPLPATRRSGEDRGLPR